ncbi:hypothetical protein KFL_001920120 [Klebsormidium nitens]|uniref:Uncharacterized protein n=1 Tax=Klebsormidium nitens TaxID=105231 RepID=A0A1Y1I5S8_KLENI|nr:hypothetical protein KFL_001920120 [Klebsormidium nitens]|eukprot:GAQ84511.1 hypothetical protein KFL_001920120 [Klebsormidium nitens]
MARVSTSAFIFVLLALSSTLAGSASSSGPEFARLTLPEPYLVNIFLVNNATNWTNPLVGAEGPRPLQVIKCQPLLKSLKKNVGPAYEFYQVQAPETGCNFPPPLEAVVRHHHLGSFVYGALFAWFYLTLVLALLMITLLGVPIAAGSLLEKRWKAVPLEEPSVPDLEAPLSISDAPQESDPVEEPRQGSEAEAEAESEGRVKSVASLETAKDLIGVYTLFTLIFVLVLAAFATTAAMKEMYPKTTIEPLGPVALPDPSQGLNQFLRETDATLSLELCKTPTMSFYVGFPDNCGRLGDPYGGVEAPAKSGPSKPKRGLFVWLTKLASLLLYSAAFSIVLLSVAGNIALIRLLLGVCGSDQLKEVVYALRVELIHLKEATADDSRRSVVFQGPGVTLWRAPS